VKGMVLMALHQVNILERFCLGCSPSSAGTATE
jgi:hypothetical protein